MSKKPFSFSEQLQAKREQSEATTASKHSLAPISTQSNVNEDRPVKRVKSQSTFNKSPPATTVTDHARSLISPPLISPARPYTSSIKQENVHTASAVNSATQEPPLSSSASTVIVGLQRHK